MSTEAIARTEQAPLAKLRFGLVRPPNALGKIRFINSQAPLNLAILGGWLRELGCDVQIRDFDVEPMDEFEPWLREFKPDIIGFTSMTPMLLITATLARRAKAVDSNIQTMLGGPHSTALPQQTLEEFPEFDFMVMGEGEIPLKHFLENWHSGDFDKGLGIAYRKPDGSIVVTDRAAAFAELDEIPMPARDLLPYHRYRGQAWRGFSRATFTTAELITSRGCPVQCIFCATDVINGKGVRFHSAERVHDELRYCAEVLGAKHIVFMDDTFTLWPKRMRQILASLKEFNLTWNCSTRVNALNKNILQEMKDAGCLGISFGVESGSPRILSQLQKKITIEQVIQCFDWAHEVGIEEIESNFILGSHPSETLEDIQATEELIARIRPTNLFVSTIVPYPGTPIYDYMLEKGLLPKTAGWDEFLFFGTKPTWRTEHFTMDELSEMQRKMLKRHYFRWHFIKHVLRKLRSFGDLWYYASSAVAFLRRPQAIIH